MFLVDFSGISVCFSSFSCVLAGVIFVSVVLSKVVAVFRVVSDVVAVVFGTSGCFTCSCFASIFNVFPAVCGAFPCFSSILADVLVVFTFLFVDFSNVFFLMTGFVRQVLPSVMSFTPLGHAQMKSL